MQDKKNTEIKKEILSYLKEKIRKGIPKIPLLSLAQFCAHYSLTPEELYRTIQEICKEHSINLIIEGE